VCTILTCTTFFLLENGSGNSFSTYLLGLGTIPLIALQFRTLPIDWTLAGLIALFLGYMTLSVLWSSNNEPVVKTFSEALLVLTFCLAVPVSIERFHWFLNALVVLVILSAVVNSGYSIYLHYALPDYQPLPEPRLYALGRLSNPVIGALSYGFAVVLAAYMFLNETRRLASAGYLAAIVLFIVAIVLTGSRGVYLAMAAAMSIGMLLHYQGNTKLQVTGVAGTLLALSAAAYFFLGPEALFSRALSFRPEIWSEFISRTITSNVWIGTGMTTDSEFQLPELLIQHPHSVFIATFYYGGLIGLALYLALVLRAIQSLGAMRQHNVRLLGCMLLAFGLTGTLLDGNELIEKVNYLWFLVWLPVGLAMIGAKHEFSGRTTN
jgi:hypothetical protein